MAKFNFKKAFSEVSKAAIDKVKEVDYDKIADKAKQAYDDFDMKETLKTGKEKINTAAETIKAKDKEDMKKDLSSMADKSAKVLHKIADVTIQTTKDVKDKIQDENEHKDDYIACESAIKVMYLIMNLDQSFDETKAQKLKFFYQSTGLQEEKYQDYINECDLMLAKAKGYDDYYSGINEGVLTVVINDYYSSHRLNKKEFLWKLFIMASVNDQYKENKVKMIKTVANALKIDQYVVQAMTQAYQEMETLDDTQVERRQEIAASIKRIIEE